jgi:hypothetical protein
MDCTANTAPLGDTSLFKTLTVVGSPGRRNAVSLTAIGGPGAVGSGSTSTLTSPMLDDGPAASAYWT